MTFFADKTAVIDSNVEIGNGTKVWHFSHVMSEARIGKNCVIGQNVFVGKNVKIGDGVKIQNNVSLYEGVVCEDEVFIGPSVVFTNVKTPRAFIERKNEFLKTIISKGATVGANATIVCGVRIGQFALIGAGALISKDIDNHALVIGNPSKQVGWVCKCGQRLELKNQISSCSRCSLKYKEELGQLLNV